MTGSIIPLDAPEFIRLFDTFTSEAFQLETLQTYGGAGEDGDVAAFLAGESAPTVEAHDAWLSMVRRNTTAGRLMRRAHVVVEPLSPYLRYEMCWPYSVCTNAGEDIRIVPSAEGWSWPPEFGYGDFWLFDSTRLYRQHHDAAGRYRGAEPVDDEAWIAWARRARDRAWSSGTPWADYVAADPALVSRVARVS